jgi:hypothetical protein
MRSGPTSWADRPESRLIIILSSERSGSTLLRVMLGGHSRIISPQELFVLRYPDFETWRASKPVAMESLLELFKLLGKPMRAADIEAACRGRSTVEMYQWVFGFLDPGALLIDKTPAYANDSSTLVRSAALSPFYIWLIRHPLGVIDSHVRLKEKERRRRPLPKRLLRPLRDAVERWTDGMSALARTRETKWVLQNLNVRNFLREIPPQQQALVRFEELVRSPEPIVRALCEVIGIAPESTVLHPETRQVMNPNLGDPNFHLHGGIDAEPAENWAARYREAQLRPETLHLMRQIGVATPPSSGSHAA